MAFCFSWVHQNICAGGDALNRGGYNSVQADYVHLLYFASESYSIKGSKGLLVVLRFWVVALLLLFALVGSIGTFLVDGCFKQRRQNFVQTELVHLLYFASRHSSFKISRRVIVAFWNWVIAIVWLFAAAGCIRTFLMEGVLWTEVGITFHRLIMSIWF